MAADLAVFLIIALITIVASVLVLESKEIFHAALFLALSFIGVAGLFVLLGAEFLAAIQVLIYAGAVIILVLFAIVLTKRDKVGAGLEEHDSSLLRFVIAAAFVFLLALPIASVAWPTHMVVEFSTAAIGISMFTEYVIPFEIISLVLLAALIGAVFLAKREDAS
ncbi:MAG: NADH-quinone oxidoreductase subunit J [Candidatus Hydrothermarchaeales archaeon]